MSVLTDKSTDSRYSLRADDFDSRPQVCLQESHRLAHRVARLALLISLIQRTISPRCLELPTAASCGQSQTLSICTLFSSCSLGTCLWGDQSYLSLQSGRSSSEAWMLQPPSAVTHLQKKTLVTEPRK